MSNLIFKDRYVVICTFPGFSDTDTFYKFLKFVVSALRDPPAITEMR